MQVVLPFSAEACEAELQLGLPFWEPVEGAHPLSGRNVWRLVLISVLQVDPVQVPDFGSAGVDMRKLHAVISINKGSSSLQAIT